MKRSFSLLVLLFMSLLVSVSVGQTSKRPAVKPISAVSKQFDVGRVWFEDNLDIKLAILDKSTGKVREDKLSVANLDTGYPFVIVGLVLQPSELKFKTTEAKLIEQNETEHKIDGYAAFSLDNYRPFPPKRQTWFDNLPITLNHDSGATVNLVWVDGTDNIEVRARGVGASLFLVFAAPKSELGYKLVLPGSAPIAVKPEAVAKK